MPLFCVILERELTVRIVSALSVFVGALSVLGLYPNENVRWEFQEEKWVQLIFSKMIRLSYGIKIPLSASISIPVNPYITSPWERFDCFNDFLSGLCLGRYVTDPL